MPDKPGTLGLRRRRLIDRYASWLSTTEKKFSAGQDIGVDSLEGAAIIDAALRFAPLSGFQPDDANTHLNTTSRAMSPDDRGDDDDDDESVASLEAVARALGDTNQAILAVSRSRSNLISEPRMARRVTQRSSPATHRCPHRRPTPRSIWRVVRVLSSIIRRQRRPAWNV